MQILAIKRGMDKAVDTAVTALKNSFYGVGPIAEFITSEIELIQGQFAIKSNI